jgi:alkanesulfonate monooxygenase SsuD/methylene tetrahydromethanopterin reductase-like flavin-dependent oxidoreductase (luciferase family)
LSSEKLGFALRPGIFSPREIAEIASFLDKTGNVSKIFIPDGRTGYEAVEVASSILSQTSRILVGTGVIRLLEHDPVFLARRIQTIQAFSSNRFILGVGTGTPDPQHGKSVTATLERIAELKEKFKSFPPEAEPPEIYLATLKTMIAKRAKGKVNSLLLNFCSPRHASHLIEAVEPQLNSTVDFACYLKIFFASGNDEAAKRLMVQEFLNYDSAPQYHQMFVQDGTANTISEFRRSDEWKSGPVDLPRELLRVSLANPSDNELRNYVRSFHDAGVTLPVVYPYFPGDEKPEPKIQTVMRISQST